MSQDWLFVWKRHWKQFGWVHKLGGVGFQGFTMAVLTVLARLIETQMPDRDTNLPVLLGEGLE